MFVLLNKIKREFFSEVVFMLSVIINVVMNGNVLLVFVVFLFVNVIMMNMSDVVLLRKKLWK